MDNSLNQTTYEKLKKDILTLELKPGDTVSAAKVAVRYNVSRTPARETLVKLETEGLVDIIPQSKSVISKIDLSKARQEWFVRRNLELAMVDKLFSNVRAADIKELRKYMDKMRELNAQKPGVENSYQYHILDDTFHRKTYEISGELLAATVISTTMAHYSRLRFMTDLEDYYKNRTTQGHEKLITLLEKKDKEGYKKALEEHLQYIINDIEDLKGKYPDYIV